MVISGMEQLPAVQLWKEGENKLKSLKDLATTINKIDAW